MATNQTQTDIAAKPSFVGNESGMASIQTVCLIAIACILLVTIVGVGGKATRWMNRNADDLRETGEATIDPLNPSDAAGFGIEDINLADLRPTDREPTVFLANHDWRYSKRSGKVAQAMKLLKDREYSHDSVELFLFTAFDETPNTHLEDMTKKELNKVVEVAGRPTIEQLSDAISQKPPTEPVTSAKLMVETIATKGGAPYTWNLATKLNNENWGRIMSAFNQLTPDQQRQFAAAFGDRSKTGEALVSDGFEKIAAISLQKGLQAAALEKTKTASEIADIMRKASKLPKVMIAPVSAAFDAYADVLENTSKDVAKMLTDPAHPRALVQKITDETQLDTVQAIKIVRHLQRVFIKRVKGDKHFEIPDHPNGGIDKFEENDD